MGKGGVFAASLALLYLGATALRAQESQTVVPEGWKATPMPLVGYISDLGFLFGAASDFYDYGSSPTLFPDYRHRIHAEASYSTKGRTLARIEHESDCVIPGVHFYVSATAQIDPLYNFYGFNGDVTAYDRSLDRRDGVAYYSYRKSSFDFRSSFQGSLTPVLKWYAGASFSYSLNDELSHRNYDSDNTLFHFYRTCGIIRDNELRGGFFEFTGGLSFDSRDLVISPSKGIWADAFFVGAPDILGTGYSYLKFCAHFRHYITLAPDWLVLAYHIAYQGTVIGEAPFFMQQNIYSTSSDQSFGKGLGGMNTLRGMMSGRLLGNDYVWANIELRCRIVSGNIAGMGWSLALNPFFDIGAITKPFRVAELSAAMGKSEEEISRLARSFHKSAGLGLKIGLDNSYIISIEGGKSFNDNDGPFSISTSINYIF